MIRALDDVCVFQLDFASTGMRLPAEIGVLDSMFRFARSPFRGQPKILR
jgi:hypothetical protein